MGFANEIDREYTYEHEYGIIGNRVGLGLIGATGLVSAISTLILLVYIGWYTFLSKNREQPMVQGIRSFSHSALGVFLCSLLLSDLIQGAAFAINFLWAAKGSMYPSVACTAQGSISQVGDLGSAIWSIAIAYYTFSLLFLLKKPPTWLTWAILLAGWTLIIVLPIVGPYVIQNLEVAGPFYAISGAWCWVGDGYQLERFTYVYMWIFFSLFTSLVLYGLVYLRFSGRLVIKEGRLVWNQSASGGNSWSFGSFFHRPSRHPTSVSGSRPNPPMPAIPAETNGIGKHLKTISKRLMLYPLVYSIVTVPVAVCRIGTMAGWKPPLPLYIFAGITFSSSGLTNVLLFIATRHSLLRRAMAVRPQIRVTTHQVTVLEDSRGGVQAIRLNQLNTTNPIEDLDDSSEKGEVDDVSVVSQSKQPRPSSSSETTPNTLVGRLDRLPSRG